MQKSLYEVSWRQDLRVVQAQHLIGSKIAKFVLNYNESKTLVSAKVQKQLQEVAAATFNNMSKLMSSIGSD